MRYLLYLNRSFRRQPKRHLTLYIILTCAFILPLLISVYRDSSAYGERQQALDMTKGAAFHIENASGEDAELFEGIDGMSAPRYEDGVIYLRFLSDEDWRDAGTVERRGELIMERIEQSGRTYLLTTAYSFDYAIESDTGDEQTVLLLLNIFIIVLSSFVVGSAYKSHLRRFSSDMGVLRSCGAENRQINGIFLTEFVVVFALSSASALLLSAGVMKLLFASFLEVRDDGFAWLIFRMDPVNTALHIAVFFIVLLAVISFTLFKFGRESMANAARNDLQSSEMTKKPKELRIKASPECSLLAIWLRRTNKTHRSCLWVSVPVMTVFLFLFAYLSLDADWVSRLPEYELAISKNGAQSGFTQEEIASVNGLTQVREIECRRASGEVPYPQSDGVYGIDIRLTSPELHEEAAAVLKQLFPGAEYEIVDSQARAERGREMSTGVYFMLLFIFAAMLGFMLIIVYMKLCDYIEDSRKTIKALSTVGASNAMIRGSYIRQSLVSAVIAAVLPAAGSVALFLLATNTVAQKPSVSASLICAYFAVSAVTACAFILPVCRSIRSILERKESIL